jgi:hypothetical protein
MAPLAAVLFSLAVLGAESARFGATLTNCAAGALTADPREYYRELAGLTERALS